jgi:hypothetical protein
MIPTAMRPRVSDHERVGAEHVDHAADQDRADHGDRHVPAGVARLLGQRRRCLEAAEGEHREAEREQHVAAAARPLERDRRQVRISAHRHDRVPFGSRSAPNCTRCPLTPPGPRSWPGRLGLARAPGRLGPTVRACARQPPPPRGGRRPEPDTDAPRRTHASSPHQAVSADNAGAQPTTRIDSQTTRFTDRRCC